MARAIAAQTVKQWLSEAQEIAFLDVREAGQFGEGHPFFAIPLPYSVLELKIWHLVPNVRVRVALLDNGDGVAERASRRLEALGYTDVNWVEGGAAGWERAGFTLFKGVNVPSKTFGELVEHARHTPRITANELAQAQKRGDRLVVVDGRPFAEFSKMNIPGGVCCPNGDMALAIDRVVPDSETRIVVNCAGRTRSIIGAETLRALGLSNPIVALENGTQGWFLAGLELERGAKRLAMAAASTASDDRAARAARLKALAIKAGAGFVTRDTFAAWRADSGRTTYLLDVRSADEHAKGIIPGAVPAPGGQLIQATDQWVGVKGARLVLVDDDGLRAPMVAHWLAQLGHETWVLEGGAGGTEGAPRTSDAGSAVAPLPSVPAHCVGAAMAAGVKVIDIRASAPFRAGHIKGAAWGIRPRIAKAISGSRVMLAGPEAEARLAAIDLREAGAEVLGVVGDDPQAWRAAGLEIAATPSDPPDAERIDYLFFVHDRHEGNAEAARQYLAWEQGLLAQLDAQERGVFRIMDAL